MDLGAGPDSSAVSIVMLKNAGGPDLHGYMLSQKVLAQIQAAVSAQLPVLLKWNAILDPKTIGLSAAAKFTWPPDAPKLD